MRSNINSTISFGDDDDPFYQFLNDLKGLLEKKTKEYELSDVELMIMVPRELYGRLVVAEPESDCEDIDVYIVEILRKYMSHLDEEEV